MFCLSRCRVRLQSSNCMLISTLGIMSLICINIVIISGYDYQCNFGTCVFAFTPASTSTHRKCKMYVEFCLFDFDKHSSSPDFDAY